MAAYYFQMCTFFEQNVCKPYASRCDETFANESSEYIVKSLTFQPTYLAYIPCSLANKNHPR